MKNLFDELQKHDKHRILEMLFETKFPGFVTEFLQKDSKFETEEKKRKYKYESLTFFKKYIQECINVFIGLADDYRESQDHDKVLSVLDKTCSKFNELLNWNLILALKKTARLKNAYFNLHVFYQNAGSIKPGDIIIINVPYQFFIGRLNSWSKLYFIQGIEELSGPFSKASLSLLLIPHWLRKSENLLFFAHVAFENNFLLITDFPNFENNDALFKYVRKLNGSIHDEYFRNVAIWYNPLKKNIYSADNSDSDVEISAAAIVSGILYKTNPFKILNNKSLVENTNIDGFDNFQNTLLKYETYFLQYHSINSIQINENGAFSFGYNTLYRGEIQQYGDFRLMRILLYLGQIIFYNIQQQCFRGIFRSPIFQNAIGDFICDVIRKQNADRFIRLSSVDTNQKKDILYLELDFYPNHLTHQFKCIMDFGESGENFNFKIKKIQKTQKQKSDNCLLLEPDNLVL